MKNTNYGNYNVIALNIKTNRDFNDQQIFHISK